MQLNEVIRGQLQRVGGQQQMLIRCQKANHPAIQPSNHPASDNYFMALCEDGDGDGDGVAVALALVRFIWLGLLFLVTLFVCLRTGKWVTIPSDWNLCCVIILGPQLSW